MPEEQRALVREARAVWEEAARKCGNPYVDSAALLLVGRMVLEATRWEDGLVILDAIRERIERESSPRRIPEWAREHGAGKRVAEHTKQKIAESQLPVDPKVRALVAGLVRQKVQQMRRMPERDTFRCANCGWQREADTCGRCKDLASWGIA